MGVRKVNHDAGTIQGESVEQSASDYPLVFVSLPPGPIHSNQHTGVLVEAVLNGKRSESEGPMDSFGLVLCGSTPIAGVDANGRCDILPPHTYPAGKYRLGEGSLLTIYHLWFTVHVPAKPALVAARSAPPALFPESAIKTRSMAQ